MGKDKKKSRDPEKQAALAAKKEAKSDKAALKRMQKEQGHNPQNDDIDAMVASMTVRQVETVEVEVLDDFPFPPRGNFTWTLSPTNGMFYMFGGEYYDGVENLVFDELLRWDPEKQSNGDKDDSDTKIGAETVKRGEWTRILTPSLRPPPRCAHSAVCYNNDIYIFGGECATAEKYNHYRDLWKLDVKKHVWEECRSRNGNPPVSRSGHRAVIWRHYMIIFGGFQESLRSETRFFNDVHFFDFQTCSWTELQFSKLARLPPPRSACNLAICTTPSEALFVYGGYSKLKIVNAPGGSKSEGLIHLDLWVLQLKSLIGGLNGVNSPSWERISRKGEYPSARAGSSCSMHKNKLLLFGGVFDTEGEHHKMTSVFYDDMFAFDLERRRWFAMKLKSSGVGGRRRKKIKEEGANISESKKVDSASDYSDDEDIERKNEGEAISRGWGLDMLRHDMFAFIDGEGNIVYEKIDDDIADVHETSGKQLMVSRDGPSEMNLFECRNGFPNTNDGTNLHRKLLHQTAVRASSSESRKGIVQGLKKVDEMDLSANVRLTPLPRINCANVVKGNTLYMYGGVLEVGDREVTLDDCWSIDLNKREKWTCIWPGQMHRQIWRGVDSDNDSYISSDQAAEESDSNETSKGFEPIHEDEEGSQDTRRVSEKEAKRAAKKAVKAGIRQEISELKEKLGIEEDGLPTSAPESAAEFYSRSPLYWDVKAAESFHLAAPDGTARLPSRDEIRAEASKLAKNRFEHMENVLRRLSELESMLRDSKEDRKENKNATSDFKAKKNRSK